MRAIQGDPSNGGMVFTEIDSSTNNFLVENYSIYYSPSLTTLDWLRSMGTKSRNSLLAVGGCNYSTSELQYLPGSKKEVEGIAKLYENNM